jgi:hypothetical protein
MRTVNKSSLYPRALIVGALVLGIGTGCLSDADRGIAQPFCAPFEPINDFRLLNNMLERRCGELDCHGAAILTADGRAAPTRPLVIYGQNGLRREGAEAFQPPVGPTDTDDYYPGGQEPTNEFELRGTYESICGLEPEEMDRVRKGEDPGILTLIRKPRLDEKHKGGRIWGTGTLQGDACLVSWLKSEPPDSEIEREACIKELEAL